MKIAGFPAGSEDLASSRIRYYTLAREWRRRGVAVSERDAVGADVLFVQKRITPAILEIAKAARQRGQAVVYDFDDVGHYLKGHAPVDRLRAFLPFVTAVTTPTSGCAAWLQREVGHDNIVVAPNAVDYYAEGCAQLDHRDCSPLRVVWFGFPHNLRLFYKYLLALAVLRDLQVVIITDLHSTATPITWRHPVRLVKKLTGWRSERVVLLHWNRDTFIGHLQSCHLSVLMHDGGHEDLVKSNSRMVTSVAWGVPALVSRTPELAQIAADAGVPDAVFGSCRGLQRAVQRYRSAAARQHYLRQAQPYLWSQYAPAVVADRLLQIFESVRR